MQTPKKPSLVLSKVFPGTAQQFRAQMQRLFSRCSEVFGSDLYCDSRLADLTLKRGTLFGLWRSSQDDLLGFRELRQLESLPESHSGTFETESQDPACVDVTPPTRSTWSVFMFPRKRHVASEDDLPTPRPRSVSHVREVSVDHLEVPRKYYEYIEKEQGFACIEAYEQHSGTRIDFLDACNPIGAMDWNLPLADVPIGSAFAEFCEWVLEEIWGEQQTIRVRLYLEDIDSFAQVQGAGPEEVSDVVGEGWFDITEDRVQRAIETVLNVPFHKEDWGGEENDLYTTNLVLGKERIATAFLLKGRGTRKRTLQIRDCGKNGDQLVRLFQSPAELFVVQFVGDISENVIKDIEGKTLLLRSQGKRAWFCVIDGQDTARLLHAYGKL